MQGCLAFNNFSNAFLTTWVTDCCEAILVLRTKIRREPRKTFLGTQDLSMHAKSSADKISALRVEAI